MRSDSRPALFFRTAVAAVVFALASAIFGAYVRLSDAALGCPDGPACSNARPAAPTAVRASFSVSASERAWKETITRYIAGTLGLLLMRLAVLGWQLRRRSGQQVIIPVATLLLVLGLTVVGIVTIDRQQKPLVMMIQFLGAILVAALLWWVVLREQRLFRSVHPTPLVRRLRWRALVALVAALFATALGGWSMANHAALACPDFPTCQGEYLPPADYAEGMLRWAREGFVYDRASLDLGAATAIHVAHRAAALIALLYVGWYALHLLRVGVQQNVCRYGLLLLVMLSFTLAFGVMEAVSGLSLTTAVAHSAVAVLLLLTLVTIYHVLRPPRNAK
ncbi:MAG TPA: COX15/CtaA family protein [Burkholderiales bacterium]